MTVPMFFFMAQVESRKWIRLTIRVLLACVVISIIGTYSRGGLLGLAVVTLAIILKSRQKALTLALVTLGIFCLLPLVLTVGRDRMGDFMHGDLDTLS